MRVRCFRIFFCFTLYTLLYRPRFGHPWLYIFLVYTKFSFSFLIILSLLDQAQKVSLQRPAGIPARCFNKSPSSYLLTSWKIRQRPARADIPTRQARQHSALEVGWLCVPVYPKLVLETGLYLSMPGFCIVLMGFQEKLTLDGYMDLWAKQLNQCFGSGSGWNFLTIQIKIIYDMTGRIWIRICNDLTGSEIIIEDQVSWWKNT